MRAKNPKNNNIIFFTFYNLSRENNAKYLRVYAFHYSALGTQIHSQMFYYIYYIWPVHHSDFPFLFVPDNTKSSGLRILSIYVYLWSSPYPTDSSDFNQARYLRGTINSKWYLYAGSIFWYFSWVRIHISSHIDNFNTMNSM